MLSVVFTATAVTFAQTIDLMDKEPTYEGGTRKYWIYFFISTVVFFFMLIYVNEWFWAAMPFMLTYLVYALKDV